MSVESGLITPQRILLSQSSNKRRYLVVPRFMGGTNNNIVVFRNAARIARALGRTLVVPTKEWIENIDINSLIKAGFSIEIDRVSKRLRHDALTYT